MARARVRFTKVGKIRWTSHRDVARMWERAFRRVGLPLAYTSGFSPRPRVSFGLALPTGHESVAEYLDFELTDGAEVVIETLPGLLTPALPVGVDVLAAARLVDGEPSLQQQVTSSSWSFVAAPGPGGTTPVGTTPVGATEIRELSDVLAARVEELLAAEDVVVTRQRKGALVTDDIRPAILGLEVSGRSCEGVLIACELASQPRSLRPDELLVAFGPDLELRQAQRLHQWIERDGARREPLALPLVATGAPHAMERVS